MSFPPGTEMFQFPGFASQTYEFSLGYSLRSGFPHSDIRGSTIARISPRLFAACHVLHRLLVPRHPPNALLCLMLLSRVDDLPLARKTAAFHMQRRTCSDQADAASNSLSRHDDRHTLRITKTTDQTAQRPRASCADDRRTLFTISYNRRCPRASPPDGAYMTRHRISDKP